MNKLKPCPFCGGEAEWDVAGDGSFSYLVNGYASIRCFDCEASTEVVFTMDGVFTPEEALRVETEAVRLWNRRV